MKLFKPDYRYPTLADVPVEDFADRGFRGVLLDIDNTLVPYGTYDKIPDENREWLNRAEKCRVKCLLYSNASGWKIEKMKEVSGLPGVPKALKPSSRLLPKALQILGCGKNEALIIGDQVCTDILGGNLAGVVSILVEPISEKDWSGTKILRMIEWFAIPDRRPWRHR